ncbi:MAG TPA: dihydroorotate dehydrogenase electron transfer subunit [Pirellulales bacterium]|jgi:dihydroorotate dehydrogenase electron transfer subunit|nr:dihydroorotate dehydrogenase electron transfer subunit [Pirellulales bacterium]
MSDSHDADCFADHASFQTVEVVENVRLATDTWRIRFRVPEMARQFVPGQFLMMRLAGYDDPLLGRPFALYDTVVADPPSLGTSSDPAPSPTDIDVVYLVMGKMTTRLARFRPGDKLDIWGPLGNGFPAPAADDLILVGGGIGQTPFLAYAREALRRRKYGESARQQSLARRVTLCYGARRADYLAGVADFEQLGVDVRISTDDGSAGHHGFVTDLVRHVLAQGGDSPSASRQIVCCGPWRMMQAVAEIARAQKVPCWASLETPMACGIGICFSCVARIRDAAGNWDYRRTCVEGPVFDAERVVW